MNEVRPFAVIALASSFAGVAPSLAIAADPNGWCLPSDACMGEQKPIAGNSWNECESSCEISAPVKVRGMNASLYDVECKGDWGSSVYRAMFVFTSNSNGGHDLLMVSNNDLVKLEQCSDARN
ncbi:hypothetical protein [Oricola sp.]|uniref:hypothetical protein n=1 Tax=Oricola sp. TaxID=1979950 RepID=UPI0025F4FB99|nr:hypothetical protein [Oricola sp.]MCI5078319.1 hypothetical protein [Oricola sp.]